MIVVRPARLTDAPAMSAVLIASITDLCVADHRGDAHVLAAWLANKTPASVAEWFGNREVTLIVAEQSREIAGVGGYSRQREILLNYVSPAYRFAGVSAALLEAMELRLGPGEARLQATETARRFYERRGWDSTGKSRELRGADGYPMKKTLH